MIAYLRGTILMQGLDFVVLDVRGVGYEVHVPLGTQGRLRPDEGSEEVSMYIYTNVRDDAIQLFGFASEDEKYIFNKLLGVNKVGPKLALAVLGDLQPGELVAAVESNDVAVLTQVSGIGKRTAQRMVLELKDKFNEMSLAAISPASDGAGPPMTQDLRSALGNLGYKSAQIDTVVEELKDKITEGEADLDELLRQSLKLLR